MGQSQKSLWAITREEAVKASQNANPEQYYAEMAIDSCFGRIKVATKKGQFDAKVRFDDSELPFMKIAIKEVEKAGFDVSFVMKENQTTVIDTILISWEEK